MIDLRKLILALIHGVNHLMKDKYYLILMMLQLL